IGSCFFFFSSRRRHTRCLSDWSSDVCSSDLTQFSIWKARMRKDWPQVRINDVQVGNQDRQNILVGESLEVSAHVFLGDVDPSHRSEERRVGKECRCRRVLEHYKGKS